MRRCATIRKFCPFLKGFDASCLTTACALWVKDDRDACCGLVYQARRQIDNRLKNRREIEELRKKWKEEHERRVELAKVEEGQGGGDA